MSATNWIPLVPVPTTTNAAGFGCANGSHVFWGGAAKCVCGALASMMPTVIPGAIHAPAITPNAGLLSDADLAEIRAKADRCDGNPRHTRCRQCTTILTLLAHIALTRSPHQPASNTAKAPLDNSYGTNTLGVSTDG